MAALKDYTNVWNTALSVLKQKGYQLWYDPKVEHFFAEKDGWDFLSPSPCGLLGLIAIYENEKPATFAEYWWRDERDLDFQTLPSAPVPYRPVGKPFSKP